MKSSKKSQVKAPRTGHPLVRLEDSTVRDVKVVGNARTVNIYTAPSPNTAAARALHRYREWVTRQCAHIDLGDLGSATDAGRSGGRLKLARIYVELDTTSQVEPKKDPRKGLRDLIGAPDSENRKPLSAAAAVLKHRRLALLGLPGSGKTTLLRHLSLHLASQPLPAGKGALKELNLKLTPLPDWPATESDLVPITVVLRRFAAECAPKAASAEIPRPAQAGRASHLWDFIQSNLREENLADAAEPLREALEAGRAVVFFDGLDEVPDDDHKHFVCQAVDNFAKSSFAPSRMVLTCRTFSYRNQDWAVPGFADVELADLDEARIKQFITAWFEALSEEGVMTAEQARNKSSTLGPGIWERGLRELAGNPLQLTNMAILHRVETLPDNRALLYDRLVRLLLLQWDKVRFDKDKLAVPLHALREEADCREEEFVDGLAWLAWQVHDPKHASRPGQPADISELELRGALERLHPSQDNTDTGQRNKADWALRVVSVFRRRGALLREEGRGVFRFPHRSYQEFLAGRHLAQQPDFARQAAGYVDDSRHWWEVVRWAANYMAYVKRSVPNALALAAELRRGAAAGEGTPLAWRRAYLAGDILAEIGVSQVRRSYELGDTCLAQTRQLLGQLIVQPEQKLCAKERVKAGVVLGKLGDPRPGVGLKNGLPEMDWIEIPPGPFLMGSHKGETDWEDETPQFECKLITQPYRISRYPVTVAQYQAFVDAGGYADKARNWWTKDGWKWKEDQKITGPKDYDPVFQTPNHPRVGVSWFEVVAFCRWLSEQLGQQIKLPNEVEWERAARHTDARAYPWPDPKDKSKVADDLAQRCNMSQTGIGHTSAVGMFPNGLAHCGAADMAGNVWEWTRSLWHKKGQETEYRYPYTADPKREDLDAPAEVRRVWRGGAFNSVTYVVRCACRVSGDPGFRYNYIGFRVVASPFASGR